MNGTPLYELELQMKFGSMPVSYTHLDVYKRQSGRFKGRIRGICAGWFPDDCYDAEGTRLGFLAYSCGTHLLPPGHGRFPAGLLDVHGPYAVLHGEQKFFA